MLKILTAFVLLGVALSILFVDAGSKFTAWEWEYPEIRLTDQGTIKELNPQVHANQIIQIIKDYQVNYVVLEREEVDCSPTRTPGSFGEKDFINYLQILKTVLEYCHSSNIKGSVILPKTQYETRRWREKKNYCWRPNWNTNEYWCQAHQRTEIHQVKTLDEVDALCIKEIFWNNISKNPLLLKGRERIFNLPMNIKEVADYQTTKTERLNKYQARQTNYHAPKEI